VPRRLAPEESALWKKVAATVKPLPKAKAPLAPVAPRMRGGVPGARPAPAAPAPRATLQAATLDGSWDKKLRSGTITPDRTLDLHGHRLDGAWSAIDDALERAIGAGDRVLLLITGHERRGEPPVERGRIRAVVHDWLASSRHAARIAAVRAAHRRHGGGGSLYIILRRP
jgi:DNA-nicking Smr family endonuclease